jgi:hypothetical protein
MIIMKTDATQEQIDHVIEEIRKQVCEPMYQKENIKRSSV